MTLQVSPGLSPAQRLAAAIAASEMAVYVYSYPSKRAYRPFDDGTTLEQIWSGLTGPINLYVHVPFCGYRCSFCTLFLTTSHGEDLRARYVDALVRQVRMYGRMLGRVEVVSLYVGGGTPTILEPREFERLFAALREVFPAWRAGGEISVEGSPDTMRRDLLAALKALGVNRVSMGLQTLDPAEALRAGRRYGIDAVRAAVDGIQAIGFDNVNYDLIYGLEGQTRDSWLRSLHETMGFGPQTVTLYPVVLRPLTAIARQQTLRGDRFLENASKYAIYDESVDCLSARGFQQNSVVRFSRCEADGLRQEASDFAGTPLIGFGAGSRSYSPGVHYSTDFAVRRRPTEEIIAAFIEHEARPGDVPSLGFVLGLEERKRRHCILNLSLGHLDSVAYERRFHSRPGDDFGAELAALEAEGCVACVADGYRLTRKGFKYSSVIATLFTSDVVRQLETDYVPA